MMYCTYFLSIASEKDNHQSKFTSTPALRVTSLASATAPLETQPEYCFYMYIVNVGPQWLQQP